MTNLPAGVTAIYTNHNTGNDVTGDGSLANPFKTAQHAMYWAHDNFKWSGGDTTQSVVEIRTADGINDSSGIHFAPHAFAGAQGGYAMRLVLGSGSQLTNSVGDVLGLYFNASLNIETRAAESGETVTLATIASGNGSCFAVSHHAHLYLGKVRVVQANGGSAIMATGGASIELTGDIEIAGNFVGIVNVQEFGQFSSHGCNFAIKGTSSWASGFVIAYGGRASFSGTITNVGANATFGKKYAVGAHGAVYAPSNPNTYFPGPLAGELNAGTYASTFGIMLPPPA